ncbi:polysaccharide deacetylase family protein [Anoxybacillus sp. B7M1]|jgi:peptidoglycan-N-acetylglucosamine deacetylase|uniref:polysaccharide deacetylase family protein n=1 Tax=unclassified Anoxybacillus TaxID=2639704 RepID=UPI0005CCD40B|nr:MULTISPECIES: polysaccharide deacetylase family protein [unclassified Anoxybacillus]ANB55965.1 polysaccharide deacetylase family protein [Anoxybacillus sp. B2M1]ANB63264.1 polysaccharide deacetylase family protein [Anoxybacillus sp. B7M1]
MRGLLIFLCVLLIYGMIPTIWIRRNAWRIYKKGMRKGAVALTFDDGPDPYYTPQLLDLLKKHDIKATFFVVGTRAAKYPDLIRRMDREGHEIGLHNYRHISNWILFPPFLQRGLRKSALIIERITGKRPVYYRPPWGHFNLFTWTLQAKYPTIMWTHILGDWKESIGVDELLRRLKNGLQDGAIIVLHDSGDTLGADKKAPAHMLKALELLFAEEEAKKMEWLTISEAINAHTNKQTLRM